MILVAILITSTVSLACGKDTFCSFGSIGVVNFQLDFKTFQWFSFFDILLVDKEEIEI